MFQIDILTIFPEICRAPLSESMMKRAQEAGLATMRIHDLRDWSTDKHRSVDDEPYGGGAGMLMKADPFFRAVEELRTPASRVILLTPQGQVFRQAIARRWAETQTHLILLCGHYEGVDHRVVEALVDDEISIGDYVLTNGAIAAVVVTDAVIRLIPGVLGDERSPIEESFGAPGILEAPHYTRPAEYRGMRVPDVLLSGHHGEIAKWRKQRAEERTRQNRPDLLPPGRDASEPIS